MSRVWLLVILAVAYGLRLWLVLSGGQDYWPDEFRYGGSTNAVHWAIEGDLQQAAVHLIGRPEHPFFRVIGLPAAILERVMGPNPAMVAAYLSLYSVFAIFFLWAVARRAGAGEAEALWVALLAAAANSLFFYSRHYLPYDAALAFILGGLWFSLGAASARRSFLAGLFVGLGYLIYNGYWLMGGVVLVLHTLLAGGTVAAAIRRALVAGTGLLTPIVLWLLAAAALGLNLLSGVRAFAGSVIRGDFGQGYRVIGEYLWYAETGTLVLWLLAIVAGIAMARRQGWPRRLTWWLGGVASMLAGFILLSDVLPKFVVHGRLARTMVPFLCLAAGTGIDLWLRSRAEPARSRWVLALIVLIPLLGAFNFAQPLRQSFPIEFSREAAQTALVTSREQPGSAYRIVFAHGIWGDIPDESPVMGQALLRRTHPLQYRPYQYESNTAAERRLINERDLSMRLVRLDRLGAPLPMSWGGYPGPIHLSVTFPADRKGEVEPLVTSGRAGLGDLFFVRYVDDRHVQFGLDHWGGPGFRTPPVPLDYGKEHDVVVILGSLVPPPGHPFYEDTPGSAHLTGHAAILLDGDVVWSSRTEFHHAPPETILFGVNVIGGSVVSGNFTGELRRISPAEQARVVQAVPALQAAQLIAHRDDVWNGALGPFRLRFGWSDHVPQDAQPLVSFGEPGSGSVLFVLPASNGDMRIGYDRIGRGTTMTEPVARQDEGWQVLDVLAGAALPPDGAPIYATHPELSRLQGVVQVRLNGQPVLTVNEPFMPVQGAVAFGANTVGSSVCRAYFEGQMAPAQLLGVDAVAQFDQRFGPLPVASDPRWLDYPGPLRLRVVFPKKPVAGAEPLLVSGQPGAADLLYVQYVDERHVRFGYDHWGLGGAVSDPIAIEPGALQNLVVSMGALMPPIDAPLYQSRPELIPLRTRLFLSVNGTTVFDLPADAHPARPDQLKAGINEVGGSTAGAQFSGEIQGLVRVAPAQVLQASRASYELQRPGWGGYPGPIQIKLTLPPPERRPSDVGEPLVTTGLTGGGDFVLIRYEGATARIGIDHWGAPVTWSEPFAVPESGEVTVLVSLGSLFPPLTHALYEQQPQVRDLRARAIIEVDGQRVLDQAQAVHPAEPATVTVGVNLIGGSTTVARFGGRIASVELADLPDVR